MTIVCGADGCRDGWVVVWHATAEQRLWWEVRPTLTSILEARPTAEVIGIDSPIGLVDKGARECDLEARRLRGFRAPARCSPLPSGRSSRPSHMLSRARFASRSTGSRCRCRRGGSSRECARSTK